MFLCVDLCLYLCKHYHRHPRHTDEWYGTFISATATAIPVAGTSMPLRAKRMGI